MTTRSYTVSTQPLRAVGAALLPAGAWWIVAAVGATGLLALLVATLDVLPVLALLLMLCAGVLLLLHPAWAAPIVVLLVYTNVPVLATRTLGVPALVASAFVLLLGLPLLHYVLVRREPLKYDATLLVMLAFLGVMIAASIHAKGPDEAIEYIKTYVTEGVILYWLIINTVRNKGALMRVIWTLLGAGALLGALTTYQVVTGSYDQEFGGLAQRNYEFRSLLELDPDDPATRELMLEFDGGRNQRAQGPMSEPNRFAQVLLFLVPLALFAFRAARTRAGRWCAAAAGLFIFAGIVFTESRAGFVVLVGLALLAAYLSWIRWAHLLMAALAASIAIVVSAPQYLERVASIANVTALAEGTTSKQADGAIRGRATQMLAAAQVFADHPVLGVGPGQYAPYYSVEYQNKNPHFQFRQIDKSRRAHSLYLEMAAELGSVGMLVFLCIFGVQLRALQRARVRWRNVSSEHVDLATAMALSLLSYLGTSIFLHLSFQRYLWLLIAISSAAIAVLAMGRSESTPTPAPAPPVWRRRSQ